MLLDRGWRRLVVLWWSLVSGLTHVSWELVWCFVYPSLSSPAAQRDWRLPWTLYARVDRRYLVGDPFVLSLELMTGLVASTLNFGVAWHVWRRRRLGSARVALLVVSVMEAYGAILYFGSEAFDRFSHVDTRSFVHTWLMFVGLNGLWLVFPGWCIYELVRELGPVGGRATREAVRE
jgi:hypothetical protein